MSNQVLRLCHSGFLLNTCMLLVANLQHLGPVPHRVVTREQLQDVLRCAEEILDETDADVLDSIILEWSTALTWTSLGEGAVDDAWYTRALLVVCLQGLRGEIQPQIYTLARPD